MSPATFQETAAAVAAGLTAYSYARLGAIRPKDAPEFQYTALAFGPRIGFMAGWLMLVADLLAVATVALGFGGYLGHLTGTSVAANATGLLVGTLLVLVAGIGQSVGLAIALTVVEAAGLLFVVAIGLPAWGRGTYLDMPHGVAGLSGAAALIFFSYLGFDEIGNFAEEMHDPTRNIPRALFLLLPLLALVMQLMYWRRKYVEHLLFFIHNHAFTFALYAILIGAMSLISNGWLTALGVLVMIFYPPLYTYRAMRRVFPQNRWLTRLKYAVLVFAYGNLLFILALVTVSYSAATL